MRRRGERKHRSGRPSQGIRQRQREEVADPAERAANIAAAGGESHPLRDKSSGEEHREEQKHDAYELALES